MSVHIQEEVDSSELEFVIDSDDEVEEIKKNDLSNPIERQIQEYKKSDVFRPKLEGIDWDNSNREELLSDVQARTSSFSLDYMTGIEMMLRKTLESRLCEKSDRFRGVARNIMSDEEVRGLLETIRIKRLGSIGGFINLPPEVKLILTGLTIVYKTYIMNDPEMRVEQERRRMAGPKSRGSGESKGEEVEEVNDEVKED